MHRFLAVFTLCLAGAASAQTVVVRSGEHATFTRLVLDLPYRAEWQMESNPGGVRIVFPGSDVVFDITRVFDRIGRNRLRAIDPAPGQLELDFACDCDLTAFWHADSMLVFDIAKTGLSNENGQRQSSTTSPNRSMSNGIRPLSAATTRLSQSLDTTVPRPRDADRTTDGETSGNDANFSIMREKLIGELGRAASQGLLTPTRTPRADPVLAPSQIASVTDTQISKTEKTVRPEPPDMMISPPSSLRVQSSANRELVSSHADMLPPDPRKNCVPVNWVDLPSWGGAGPFHRQIGDLNRRLLHEFDKPNEEVTFNLARTYLYFGFGAEARQVLDFRPNESAEAQILRELTLIMDRAKTSDDARIAKSAGCGEPAVLWALLAMPIVPADTVFDHKALLRSFSALPGHLRETFGPELARRLIEARHAQTAKSILRMTERTDGSEVSDLALARADLANADDDRTTVGIELNNAVAKNSEIAPKALAQLIEDQISNTMPVPFDKAELAGAYAFENRGTDLGRQMARAYVAALGASGAFAEAVSEFARLRPDFDTTEAADLATSLIQQMTRDADDVTFLRHVLSNELTTPDLIPATLAVAVAKRLLKSGFADQAKAFVAVELPGREARMSKVVRAQIALMQTRPRQAEVELLGLDDTKANALRAEAKSLAGDHTAAQALYIANDQMEKASEAAWLAQDLDELSRASDPVLRQTAEILQNTSQELQDSLKQPLERHQDLLESASTLRAALNTLLDTKHAPADP